METNETILTRDVVVIDSHKKIGSVKALRVDCDTMAVQHYIVNNASTGSSLVLPFNKALAVGDTFMTVQNLGDFLATNDADATRVLSDGYTLLSEEVYSKTGNKLSAVKNFEFDPIRGAVTKLMLENGSSFEAQSFMFFSPEFIFIDDGAPTAAELRSHPAQAAAPAATSALDGAAAAPAEAASGVSQSNGEDAALDYTSLAAEDDGDESEAAGESSEEEAFDEEIVEFLVGSTLQADVESEDGAFKALAGTVLTRELIVEASEHDALLLLTINVEA